LGFIEVGCARERIVLCFEEEKRGRGDSEGRKELSLSRGRAQLDQDLVTIDRLETGPQTTRAGVRQEESDSSFKIDGMIESLGELKDCGQARSSTPAVGIHSSATACGMMLDEGV
jgi:hypothetical protein